jgi:O-antigen ligase/polysaccharide polymerase Wzy-like membrane protein
VLLVIPSNAGLPILRSIVARLASLGSPTSGSMATRLHIWHDTLALVASRPLTGYGPDTFGLAYPSFQTGNWTPGLLIDKAHGDLLQVAATQGLIGVAAYLWTLVAFVKSFLEGGRGQAAGVFGGFVAYELQLQVNFSYLPAAAPFWVFAAAAVILWTHRTHPETDHARRRHVRSGRPWATLPASLAVIGLILPAVIFPYLADVKYRDALADVARADQMGARVDLDQARRLSPNESAYAAEAGDLALGAHGDLFGPNPDWSTARLEFDDAVRLGTFLPSIYRHLAMVDEHLGLYDEAIAAARRAVTLNRYDPANQQLLDRLTQSPSGG